MQLNTIKRNITKKLEEWLDTISDKTLRASLRYNIVVSGGCISSMLLNEPVNDYDIYLKNLSVLKDLCDYYVKGYDEISILDGRDKDKLIKDLNVDISENISYCISLRNLKEDQIKLYMEMGGGSKANESDEKYSPQFFSPNAISLSDDIQIVLRFSGSVKEIHSTFDFVHATNYFTFSNGLVTNKKALESILTKKLVYQGSHYPITSIIRSKKFVKRGFNISAGEQLKIMYQISKLDLDNYDVLEDQLIGVDVAYFSQLITNLRNDRGKGIRISPDRFNKIIDMLFNEDSDE